MIRKNNYYKEEAKKLSQAQKERLIIDYINACYISSNCPAHVIDVELGFNKLKVISRDNNDLHIDCDTKFIPLNRFIQKILEYATGSYEDIINVSIKIRKNLKKLRNLATIYGNEELLKIAVSLYEETDNILNELDGIKITDSRLVRGDIKNSIIKIAVKAFEELETIENQKTLIIAKF